MIDSAVFTAQQQVELKPDLVLTLTPTSSQIDMGGTLSMMLNFTNHGQYAADGATATQTLPAGLEFVASAPTGAWCKVAIFQLASTQWWVCLICVVCC